MSKLISGDSKFYEEKTTKQRVRKSLWVEGSKLDCRLGSLGLMEEVIPELREN